MRLLHHAFATSYPALNLFRRFGHFTGYDRSTCLRVLLYHDIAPEEHENFKRQLGWLSRHWTFISPEHFAAVISGDATIQNKSLLLTFVNKTGKTPQETCLCLACPTICSNVPVPKCLFFR